MKKLLLPLFCIVAYSCTTSNNENRVDNDSIMIQQEIGVLADSVAMTDAIDEDIVNLLDDDDDLQQFTEELDSQDAESTQLDKLRKQSIIEKGNWSIRKFIDDYGDYTDIRYLSGEGNGIFSNSATDNSRLTIRLIVEPNFCRFKLYEYDNMLVTPDPFGKDLYDVKISLENNTLIEEYIKPDKDGSFVIKNSELLFDRITSEYYDEIKISAKSDRCSYGGKISLRKFLEAFELITKL